MTPFAPVLDERPSPGPPGDEDDPDPHAAQGAELLVGSDPVEVAEPSTPPDPPTPSPVIDLDVSPIFVDSTGHRRRRARRLAWAVAAVCMIYLALFGAGLAGRPVNPSAPSGVLVGGPSSTTSEATTVTTSAALPLIPGVGPSRTTTRATATARRTATTTRRSTQAIVPQPSVLSPTPSRQSSIWPSTTTTGSTTGSSPTTSSSTGVTTTTRSEETSSTADTDEPDTDTETETDTDTDTETDTETDQTDTDQTDTDESEAVPSAGSSR
jgi:hypothetical protein